VCCLFLSQHRFACAATEDAGGGSNAEGNPASEDVQAARKKALQLVTKPRAMRLNKAAQLVETGVVEDPGLLPVPGGVAKR
jgi:hypothetical protein